MPVGREKLLLDLFTEIAVIEHLVRNHMSTIDHIELTAGQFGALNYFVRNNRTQERASILAWCFQVTEDEMDVHLDVLEERGFIARRMDGNERMVLLTGAGRDAHAREMEAMAPAIEPLMAEFPDGDLEKTVSVLQEIRRTFDNLPER